MPQLVGFIGPSYAAKSPNVDVQRTINLYPELGEIGDEKNQEIASLVGTPGLKGIIGVFIPFAGSSTKPSIELLPRAPCRGFYLTSKDRLFGVTGNVVWELGNTATYQGTHFGNGDVFIVRGQIGTTIGPVSMTDNGTQLIIVDGQKGYIYDLVAESLDEIPTERSPSTKIVLQTVSNLPGLAETGGGIGWVNPENALADDGVFTTQTIASDGSSGTTSVIRFDSFNQTSETLAGIEFPDDAVLAGLSFDISCLATLSGSGTLGQDMQFLAEVFKGGASSPVSQKTVNISTKLGVVTVGGTGDLWGTTWTKDEINNPKMALQLTPIGPTASSGVVTAVFKIDSVTRNVHFNAVDTSNPSEFPEAPQDALTGGPTIAEFLDQYFIVNRPDTQQFFFSALGDGTSWDGLDVGDKEGQPDNLATLIVNDKELWLLGNQTSEIWYNSGDPDSPFQRIQSAFIEHGIAAVGTAKKLLGAVIWVSQDRNGDPMVLKAVGHQPNRISTYPLERKLKSFGDIAKATAYTYQRGGHGFYCLNIPGADTTFVYDVSTNLWHDRQSMRTSGFMGRHRAENCVFFRGRHIVGDFENHNLYELDEDTFTDAGAVIPRIRRAPHIAKNGKPFILANLALEMETGLGNTEAMVRVSKDYGHTWSSEKSIVTKIGEYLKRLVFRQFGQARDFAVEAKVISDGPVTLVSMFYNQ